MNSLKESILALDPDRLQELSGIKMEANDMQKAFYRSLDGLKAAFSALGPSLRLPPGVSALLKHAYECVISRDFSFDTTGSNVTQIRSASFYPLIRLLLQGLIARVWKDPISYNRRSKQCHLGGVKDSEFRVIENLGVRIYNDICSK